VVVDLEGAGADPWCVAAAGDAPLALQLGVGSGLDDLPGLLGAAA
jgi:hypothetical protein